MRKLAIGLSALALTLPATGQTLEGVDAGIYELEKTHAFLTWSASFLQWEGQFACAFRWNFGKRRQK